jgi:hypothetical protein
MERLQDADDMKQPRRPVKSVAFVRGVEGSLDSQSIGGKSSSASSNGGLMARQSDRAPSIASTDPNAQIQFGVAE